jgi:2-methylisocitrate lyase-like PEP mutase family enzyme
MADQDHRKRLKNFLVSDQVVVAPGIYDGVSAWLAQKAGFDVAFLSGSAVAFSQLASPDIGLVTLTELASTLTRIRERVDLSIIVDADSGFGNALNVQRTVRTLERAGASGIQIEDQLNTKRVQDVQSRPLVAVSEMVGKIKAAQDAKRDADTVISARSDAFFSLGLQESLDRAEAYLEAGADMLFVEGLSSKAELEALSVRFKGRVPLLYNMLAQGQTPLLGPDDLTAMGISIILHPATAIESASNASFNALVELKATGNGVAPPVQVTHVSMNELLDATAYIRVGARYENKN